MALLSFEEEEDRARPLQPFANGFEGEAWMSLWCDHCRNDAEDDCPLVAVAVLGQTPAAWDDAHPGALNRYVCNEFDRMQEDS